MKNSRRRCDGGARICGKKGSGNAGLTNFLRNFGGWATLLVVLMDMGKVVLACLLGRWLLPGNPQLGMMIAGAMTELGHIFPVFYGFRGGIFFVR